MKMETKETTQIKLNITEENQTKRVNASSEIGFVFVQQYEHFSRFARVRNKDIEAFEKGDTSKALYYESFAHSNPHPVR